MIKKIKGMCEYCKKEKATGYINKKRCCGECFRYVKNGNGHLIGKEEGLGWDG